MPVVHKLALALQPWIPFLNPEYLVDASVGSANAKLPRLIFRPGAPGVGQDIPPIKARPTDGGKGIDKFEKRPCIVVVPQGLKTARGEQGLWTAEDLNLLLQHVKPTRPVDERRIYLTGISPGGYGTWAWGPHDLPHFAAIAPIVGGTGREGAKAMTPDCAPWDAGRARIPVDALVGAPDTTAPPDRSERMIAAIPKAGGKEAKLAFDPEEGQGAGRGALPIRNITVGSVAQKRDASPQPAVFTAGPGTTPSRLCAIAPIP